MFLTLLNLNQDIAKQGVIITRISFPGLYPFIWAVSEIPLGKLLESLHTKPRITALHPFLFDLIIPNRNDTTWRIPDY